MSKSENASTLGSFLNFHYWTKAIELLLAQVNLINKNRHFNQPSMFYYQFMKALDPDGINIISTEDYYETKIANNLFYVLEKEFNVIPYNLPKSNLSLRYYKFMTYPLRVLYYAVGLYILDLTQEFVKICNDGYPNIKSFYGGELKFSPDRNLGLHQDNLYYLKQYRAFKKEIKSAIVEKENKFVIHLDVQNYYDHISIPDLLDKITNTVNKVHLKDHNFTHQNADQVINFISYLMNYDTKGIPQMDNDIISSYLGFLYLVFSDISIYELLKNNNSILNFEIIRYMDDMYIVIEFNDNIDRIKQVNFLNKIIPQLPDILDRELKLRLGVKNKFFRLDNVADYEALVKQLKKVSDTYEITEADLIDDPLPKVNEIKRLLTQYAESKLTLIEALDDTTLDHDILKEIYDKRVASIFLKEENQNYLATTLEKINFEMINIRPKELFILIFNDNYAEPMKSIQKKFRTWLLNKEVVHTRDAYLILTYTCQTNFLYIDIFLKLKDYYPLASIVDYISSKRLPYSEGYYQLNHDQVMKITSFHIAIQQVLLRRKHEVKAEYSIALGHLLNEIQEICFELDQSSKKPQKKDYKSTHVSKFLESKSIDPLICLKIKELFDRRNRTPVAHPEDWSVKKDEYEAYKMIVGTCLDKLL